MSGRAVFLDRDGVLNRVTVRDGVPHPPNSVDELHILPGVADALNDLRQAQFHLIVVTNQPDVARGTQTRERVEEINSALRRQLPVGEVVVCYHDNADQCLCRKPKPGMILDAAARFDLDPTRSFMVGDRWGDIVAGETAGCITFLIEESYSGAAKCRPNYRVADLSEAARIILQLGQR